MASALQRITTGSRGTVVWRADLRRMKDLEEENDRLKRMFADLSLPHEATKELIKKRVGNGGAV